MDHADFFDLAYKLRACLIEEGVEPDMIILFGSQATGRHHPESDVDIAVCARSYGHDWQAESIQLNRILYHLRPNCEGVAVNTHEYFDPTNPSPIVAEIRRDGICLI